MQNYNLFFLYRGKFQTVAENKAFREINEVFIKNGITPSDLGLPNVPPDDGEEEEGDDHRNEIDQGGSEPGFDEELAKTSNSLKEDQKTIYDKVMAAVANDDDPNRLIYLNGTGGMGKTFTYNAIIGELRRSKILRCYFSIFLKILFSFWKKSKAGNDSNAEKDKTIFVLVNHF